MYRTQNMYKFSLQRQAKSKKPSSGPKVCPDPSLKNHQAKQNAACSIQMRPDRRNSVSPLPTKYRESTSTCSLSLGMQNQKSRSVRAAVVLTPAAVSRDLHGQTSSPCCRHYDGHESHQPVFAAVCLSTHWSSSQSWSTGMSRPVRPCAAASFLAQERAKMDAETC